MGIREMIQKKKDQFFVARDSDKRALQIQNLQKQAAIAKDERQQTEQVRRLQSEISGNKAKIKEARTAGTRGIAQSIGKRFQSFATGAKKASQGVSQFGGGPNKNSPFYTGGVMGTPAPKAKKASNGKNIHIHLGK